MPENLYKRGKVWWARANVGGREYRRTLRTSSRAEAKKRRDQWLADLQHIRWDGEPRHSWKHVVACYSEDVLSSAVKPATAKRYRVSLGQLEPAFINLHVDEITPRRIAGYVRARKKEGATNATIKRDLTALSRLLGYACSQGWLETNAAKLYDRTLLRERRDPIRPPTDSELKAFVDACTPMLGRMVTLLAQTGMRLEEAATLEWPQVDIPAREITLLKTKTNRPRVVPLTEEAVGTLVGTPRHLHSAVVFHKSSGKRYHKVTTRLSAIRVRNGLKFRTHDLRHKFGIEYLRQHGYDRLPTLSRILGHTSIKTTEMYVAYLNTDSAQKSAQAGRFSASGETA